jgi:hypothetical protein
MPIWNSSHLISFDARNGTRNLIDPISNLDYTFNSSNELINPAIASIFDFTVNSQDEFTDPIAGNILDYAINGSCNIIDLETANFL